MIVFHEVTMLFWMIRKCLYLMSSSTQRNIQITRFFIINAFFSTQLYSCLTFSWIELRMLLRYWLIYVTIITLRHIRHLVYLCLSIGLGRILSYLFDLFFYFQPHFQCHHFLVDVLLPQILKLFYDRCNEIGR